MRSALQKTGLGCPKAFVLTPRYEDLTPVLGPVEITLPFASHVMVHDCWY
jgi:hypothetical protein